MSFSTQERDLQESLLLAAGIHPEPHRFLGLHSDSQKSLIRLWRPDAEEVSFELFGQSVKMTKKGDLGLFEYVSDKKVGPKDYQIYHPSGLQGFDPYAQKVRLKEMELFLFSKAKHYTLYNILGAKLKKEGVLFTLWAPNASRVSLIGDFNSWDGRLNPMRSLGASGIWEIFIPSLQEGEKYQFEIRTQEGIIQVKSDPFAFYSEKRPHTASIVFDIGKYIWKDTSWKRPKIDGPIHIYELHLGSWMCFGKEFANYRDIAPELAKYVKKMGFTHVELLPIMEHPLDESWGYQVSGFFAPTSRYGKPSDFQYFVDLMHQEGIGVILDWVSAHFPQDEHALSLFDGSSLFEHDDPQKGFHPLWTGSIFHYGKKEVQNFLIASALFWIDQMHIDGLRVDAVHSLLYLDYGRKEGEWTPNPDGSNINYEAAYFLKRLNRIIHERFQDVLMIAEDSSSYPQVTGSSGLGFDLKWNLGWVNDTLSYFSKDFAERPRFQQNLTFSLLYTFKEKFLIPLSHDEVARGKKSFLKKMRGFDAEKLAGLKVLYSYMMCHPGKKLTFMGTEIAALSEWSCKEPLEWKLKKEDLHGAISKMVRDLNHLYLQESALWEYDFDWRGYEWVDFSDAEHSVISYLRKGSKKTLFCIHHFACQTLKDYRILFKGVKSLTLLFNSDEEKYGGKSPPHQKATVLDGFIWVDIAPLATYIFELEYEDSEDKKRIS